MNIYDYKYNNNAGEETSMSKFKNKTLLVVNVASRCGMTPQYEGLQKLYADNKDNNFEILAFPCNQFGEQEPGTDQEILQFCSTNYGVTFELAQKIDVNGDSAHPIYKYLKDNAKNGNDIGWNFEKFLIKDGVITNYQPDFQPAEIQKYI